MDLQTLQTYTQARKVFFKTQADIKNLESTLLPMKRNLPQLRSAYYSSRNPCYATCGYNLTGQEKHDIYVVKKSKFKKISTQTPPLCLQKYFTPVVESIDAGDVDKNNQFIRYFLDTWFDCDCANSTTSKEKNSKHRCDINKYRNSYCVFTDLYKAEGCDIHVIFYQRYGRSAFSYLLPPKTRITVHNQRSSCNFVDMTQMDRFAPWELPLLWDWLIDIHRQTIACKRVQRAWRQRAI